MSFLRRGFERLSRASRRGAHPGAGERGEAAGSGAPVRAPRPSPRKHGARGPHTMPGVPPFYLSGGVDHGGSRGERRGTGCRALLRISLARRKAGGSENPRWAPGRAERAPGARGPAASVMSAPSVELLPVGAGARKLTLAPRSIFPMSFRGAPPGGPLYAPPKLGWGEG